MEKLIALPTGVTLNVNFLGDAGFGPPLLVIHGGPSWSHHYLLPGLERVAAVRQVIAPDLRGCGLSSCDLPLDQYQPELAVEDLLALIDRLGLERVDVLGFSTGGQWAQLFVERAPQRVRRLVLASTTAFADFYDELRVSPEYQQRQSVPDLVPAGESALERTTAWAINGTPTSIWDLAKSDAYRALLKQTVFTGDWLEPFERRLLHPHRPADPVAVLRDFGGPVLILHGRHDLTFPLSVARRLHAELPEGTLHILDDSGHQAQFEQPEEWAQAVVDFLAASRCSTTDKVTDSFWSKEKYVDSGHRSGRLDARTAPGGISCGQCPRE